MLCNGFKIRGLNADCDRLAVQSSEQTTWLLGWRRFGIAKWHEVAIQQNELIVLRPYGGCPEIEILPLGDKCGTLKVEATRSATRLVRVGTRHRLSLGLDESVVITCSLISHPSNPGVQPGAYGPGLRI